MNSQPEKLTQTRELAEKLYGALAIMAGPSNWDWKPVATTAIEAAEVFCSTFDERYTPQSAVPVDDVVSSDDAATTPAPTDEAPTPPQAVSHTVSTIAGPPL